MEFYSRKSILKYNAVYNVIFGERSNGKSYQILDYALEKYFLSNGEEQLAIIRRTMEDFRGADSQRTCYESLMCNAYGENKIIEYSDGEYCGVTYKAGHYVLTKFDEEKNEVVPTDKIIAYGFALSAGERSKGSSFPHITTILFEEFITRGFYLTDEFTLFMNLLSTIIRHRNNVKIFMCGNTISQYNPYFEEMGLTQASSMLQGTIDLYKFGESNLTVAVEYTGATKSKKPSDVYFAFDNPKLQMITGGSWELSIYPHCPEKYQRGDIKFTFFVKHRGKNMQCEIIQTGLSDFLYIHKKTTPIKNDRDLVYSLEPSPLYFSRINLLRDDTRISEKIRRYLSNKKVFYQNNDIGELFNDYLKQCVQ